MNRDEFLRQLEVLLSGISEEERTDAMAFYRSYFEDAGEENEASIIAELESPQKVAESILKNMGIDGNAGGYNAFANRDAEYYRNLNETQKNLARQNGAQENQKKDRSTGMIVGTIIAVLTLPVWGTLLLCIICVLLAIAATLFALVLAVAATMVALVICGFILMGVGFASIFEGMGIVGVGLIGAGLLVLALGLLAVVLCVWMFGVFLPWALKGIWKLCKMPFERRKEQKAV